MDLGKLSPVKPQPYQLIPNTIHKRSVRIYGANYNWFNSMWTKDDASDFPDRLFEVSYDDHVRLGAAYVSAFLLSNLLGESAYDSIFTGDITFPCLQSPPSPITFSYHDPWSNTFENGDGSQISGSGGGDLTTLSFETIERTLRCNEYRFGEDTDALRIYWRGVPGQQRPYIEYSGNWSLSAFKVLSFRVAWTDWFDWNIGHPAFFGNLIVELSGGGRTSAVSTNEFRAIPKPYHPYPRHPYSHPCFDGNIPGSDPLPYNTMTTIRIPLAAFMMNRSTALDFKVHPVERVRIYFDSPLEGEVYLDDIEFSR